MGCDPWTQDSIHQKKELIDLYLLTKWTKENQKARKGRRLAMVQIKNSSALAIWFYTVVTYNIYISQEGNVCLYLHNKTRQKT